MSAAEDVFESLAAEQVSVEGVTRRMMFGRDTLLSGGHPYAFRVGDRIALKLPDAAEVLASGEGTPPRMGKRVMRQWVALPLVASGPLTERVESARRSVVH